VFSFLDDQNSFSYCVVVFSPPKKARQFEKALCENGGKKDAETRGVVGNTGILYLNVESYLNALLKLKDCSIIKKRT
jgi:hypothetical protein